MVVLSPQYGENTAFLSSFPLVYFKPEVFYRLSFWNLKKVSAISYGTASVFWRQGPCNGLGKKNRFCLWKRLTSWCGVFVYGFSLLKIRSVRNKKGCAIENGWCFSLKSQRNSRQNALALDSAKRKTGEKDCLFTILWRWNNHTLWQGLWRQWPCNGIRVRSCR